ncbi:MAG: ABC transporter ATP-binding protein [Alphaproteobacteria bacterium]
MSALTVDDLHLAIGKTSVLRGVSLDLPAGSVHGLVGESGAGKTMVARAVLGITPRRARITAGRIAIAGQDVTAGKRPLGKGVALIPQDPISALNPVHRIGRQIGDALRLHLGLDRKATDTRVLELLDHVHIREPERVARQYPHELSGGMRQRVLIAAAFACRPPLIIADEPTTALDVTVQRQILRLIRELQREAGTAILFVTHDLGVVAKVCDQVSVMHAGRIVEQAPVETIFAAPAHAYTAALFQATPRYDRPADALRPVPANLHDDLLAEAAAYDRARR